MSEEKIRRLIPLTAASLLTVFLLITVAPTAFAWQYGENTSPISQVSSYDNAYMTTSALSYKSTPTAGVSWWEDSYTIGSVPWWGQEGPLWTYTGTCIFSGPHCIPAQSWGLLRVWSHNSQYYGDGVLFSTLHANPTDTILYSETVYPNYHGGCFSFEFDDVTSGYTAFVGASNTGANALFSSSHGPDALMESAATSGFGGLRLRGIALYAQSISTGKAYADNTYSALSGTLPSSPNNPLTYYSVNNYVTLGWQFGTTFSYAGYLMWSQTTSQTSANIAPSSACP